MCMSGVGSRSGDSLRMLNLKFGCNDFDPHVPGDRWNIGGWQLSFKSVFGRGLAWPRTLITERIRCLSEVQRFRLRFLTYILRIADAPAESRK